MFGNLKNKNMMENLRLKNMRIETVRIWKQNLGSKEKKNRIPQKNYIYKKIDPEKCIIFSRIFEIFDTFEILFSIFSRTKYMMYMYLQYCRIYGQLNTYIFTIYCHQLFDCACSAHCFKQFRAYWFYISRA